MEIYLNKKVTILLFTLTFFQTTLLILGILNKIIILTIPFIVFFFHNLFFTLNFFYLFNKQPIITITNKEFNYLLLNLKINIEDIELISYQYEKGKLVVIQLYHFEKYKKYLSLSLIGKIMLFNFKSLNKDVIFFRKSFLAISDQQLKNDISKFIPKEKISI